MELWHWLVIFSVEAVLMTLAIAKGNIEGYFSMFGVVILSVGVFIGWLL